MNGPLYRRIGKKWLYHVVLLPKNFQKMGRTTWHFSKFLSIFIRKSPFFVKIFRLRRYFFKKKWLIFHSKWFFGGNRAQKTSFLRASFWRYRKFLGLFLEGTSYFWGLSPPSLRTYAARTPKKVKNRAEGAKILRKKCIF